MSHEHFRGGAGARCFGLLIAAVAVLGAGPAAAEDDCTWLPDFRCDRESGRWDGWAKTMSIPYYFEDPFITTDLVGVGIWHDIPSDSAFNGGEAGILALQARLALTDRLGFIATMDGFTIFRPGTPVVPDEEGFMDLILGFKYALIEWKERGFILTPNLRYQIPSGTNRLYQGNGAGAFIVGASAGWSPMKLFEVDLDDMHFIGDMGFYIPVDPQKNSSFMFWNAHLDYAVAKHFVPFIEFNGFSYTGNGNGQLGIDTNGLGTVPLSAVQTVTGSGPFEGLDFANLGSQGVAGDNIVTFAAGAWIPIGKHWALGAQYERAITSVRYIFEQRVTATLSFTL